MKRLKTIITASLLLLIVIAAGCLSFISSHMAQTRHEQHSAEKFSTETVSTSLVSLFIPSSENLRISGIYAFRESFDSAFLADSIVSGGGRTYIDAYSSFGRISATTERGSVTANVTYTGGSFFYIHEIPLSHGEYIPENPLTNDLAVIDENVAWGLFGALDVSGFEMRIQGKIFTVAGVSKLPESDADKKAYGEFGRIFLSYDAFGEGSSPAITCYEAILPNPIDSYAKNTLSSAASSYEEKGIVFENSGRYKVFFRLFETLQGMGIRSMREHELAYPYWENAAGVYEDTCAILLLMRLFLYAAAFIILIVTAVFKYKKITSFASSLFEKTKNRISGLYDRIKCRGYYKRQKKMKTEREK